MNLRIFDSTDDLIRGAAATILQRVSGKDRATVALSGGSTPKPLYELLGASPYREELAKTHVIWVVVDERYVPLEDPQSNAAMIQRTLFRDGMSPGHEFLRFRTELNDPAKTARQFESDWKGLAIDKLDVILLGVGDDGHTASLFPGTPVLDVNDRIAAEVFVPRLNQWRVTLTLPVIREAGLRMILAAGESKRKILDDVRRGVDHPVVRATGGAIESWWFVDQPATAGPEASALRNRKERR
ncbi:MAG TPA: 6-phosphogluconolactonase [Thermoanaerobaculia bacterium]|nr:6-phosphogluconolactonase [Thermoanaerobaculia bacterium]